MQIEYLVRYRTVEERAELIRFLQAKGYIYEPTGANGCENDSDGTIDLYYWDKFGSHAFFIGKSISKKVFEKARPAFAAAYVSSQKPGRIAYTVSEFKEKLGHTSITNAVPEDSPTANVID